MGNVAVRVEALGKRYLIGGKQKSYRTFRETVTDSVTSPIRRINDVFRGRAASAGGQTEPMWALKDVSFDVKHGDVVGIIGRNGAGKSTLLKILSRITEPTEGSIKINGRIGALLEVGTGFHPELTGRENIYLNAAILGMPRSEIYRKFDEIVEFAEVEKFIETPVKHYSSGMGLRLGFSVAAHLEPDILIVDEVLAVGDVAFQKKCLGKMSEVAGEGRTVFFVSHNLPAISRLCNRAVLLSGGRLVADGSTASVTSIYMNSDMNTMASREWESVATAPGNHNVRLLGVYARKLSGEVSETFEIREPIVVDLKYEVLLDDYPLVPVVRIVNQDGVVLFTAVDQQQELHRTRRKPGLYSTKITIPGNLLAEGFVTVLVTINTFTPVIAHVNEPDVISFQIVEDSEVNITRSIYGGQLVGVMRPDLNWDTNQIAASSG